MVMHGKYMEAGYIKEIKGLDLVKAFYTDGILSLRYKNEASNYIDTMELMSSYIEILKTNGYIEKSVANSKSIYENEKYRIVMMEEFDYLIVIIEKV